MKMCYSTEVGDFSKFEGLYKQKKSQNMTSHSSLCLVLRLQQVERTRNYSKSHITMTTGGVTYCPPPIDETWKNYELSLYIIQALGLGKIPVSPPPPLNTAT